MTLPGWVSFDCYGTLVDWNRGITATMEALAPGRGAELRRLYGAVEAEIEAETPARPYREVLAEGLHRSSLAAGLEPPSGAGSALQDSLPWVNREGDDGDPSLATAVIPDLSTLPDVVAALLRG